MNEPSTVYLVMSDGEEVPCLVEKIGEDEWQATPVKDVDGGKLASTYVDMLPAGAKLSFVLVFDEEDE